MKNLLNYGVQEMNAEEKIEVTGGYTQTHYETVNGVKYKVVDWYRAGANGAYYIYRTDVYQNGKKLRGSSGQGIINQL